MSEHQFVYTNSQLAPEQRIAQLETELREARKDNSDVRRQLASKVPWQHVTQHCTVRGRPTR
jgi:hypothetical protein